jgi:hypothetical protein
MEIEYTCELVQGRTADVLIICTLTPGELEAGHFIPSDQPQSFGTSG